MLNPAFTRIGLSPIVEISERIRDVAPGWEARTGRNSPTCSGANWPTTHPPTSRGRWRRPSRPD